MPGLLIPRRLRSAVRQRAGDAARQNDRLTDFRRAQLRWMRSRWTRLVRTRSTIELVEELGRICPPGVNGKNARRAWRSRNSRAQNSLAGAEAAARPSGPTTIARNRGSISAKPNRSSQIDESWKGPDEETEVALGTEAGEDDGGICFARTMKRFGALPM